MKKLLYVGGAHSDIPLIQAAKSIGLYVITTGNNENDLGHQYSDEYYKSDYSDKEAILDLAKKLRIDYLCPCCNDFSILTCSYVAERLGLPGFDSFDVTQIVHHKDKFREFCHKYGFPVPKAMSFNNVDEAIKSLNNFNFPIIVKPIDLTGGKGVSRIKNEYEAYDLIKKAFTISKQKKIVIEEFIEGANHGLSTFIINKKVVFYFYDNEHYYINKYLVSGASCPGSVPHEIIEKLCKIYEKMAELLNLKNGIFHTQFILKDNLPYITEICRRPPGDLYVKLVEYATGIQYSHYIVKAFCDMDLNGLVHKDVNGFYTRHCIMTNANGIFKQVKILPEVKNNIFDIIFLLKKGDIINDYLTQKAGIAFLKYQSMDEMIQKLTHLNEFIKIEFK